jgi:hypothetical protein
MPKIYTLFNSVKDTVPEQHVAKCYKALRVIIRERTRGYPDDVNVLLMNEYADKVKEGLTTAFTEKQALDLLEILQGCVHSSQENPRKRRRSISSFTESEVSSDESTESDEEEESDESEEESAYNSSDEDYEPSLVHKCIEIKQQNTWGTFTLSMLAFFNIAISTVIAAKVYNIDIVSVADRFLHPSFM